MSDRVRAGVVGVGSMGQNHAAAYDSLDGVALEGVADADQERAADVAADWGTRAADVDALLDAVDVASVAVPTQYHYDVASQALDAGVDVLVEKPFVADVAQGRELIEQAERADATLQVGHVERFNPAVQAVSRIVEDLDVIAVTAERLTPPPERAIDDSATMDLMVHDIDIAMSLADGCVQRCDAAGTRDGRYAVGTLEFDAGALCTLTASRVTQEAVRRLTVSAETCRVKADLLAGTVEVHRASAADVADDVEGVDCRGEDLVEELDVEDDEPLARELRAFVDATRSGTAPPVSGEDGLRVLEIARAIERQQDGGGVPRDLAEGTPS